MPFPMTRPSFVHVYLAVTALLLLASFFLLGDKGAVADVKLADAGKATLDYLTEIGKFIVTLNTALFSATGALAIKGHDWSTRWSATDGYLLVLALIAGSMSYYGAYMAHMAILEMIYSGIIDPFSGRLSLALNVQYYGLLVGIFLVGLVFVRMLAGRKGILRPEAAEPGA
jgi:hypothetical protein